MSTQRILSNVAWAGSLKIAGVLFTMAVNVLVTRMLGVEYVGYYFLTSSLAVFGALVARFGMRQSVVKLVAQQVALGRFSTAAGIIRKILTTTAAGVLITAAILILMRNWIHLQLFRNSQFHFVTYVILWMGLVAFQSILSDVFRAFQNIDLSSLLDGVLVNGIVGGILLLTFLAAFTVSFRGVIIITIAAYALVTALAFWLLARKMAGFSGADESTYHEVVKVSLPIFIVNLSTYLAAEASLWFVAYFGRPGEIALYGVCLKLVKLVTLPLLIQNIVVTPLIVELHTKNQLAELQKLVKGAATLTAIPSVILIGIYAVAGDHVLSLLFGNPYADGWNLLYVMSAGYLVNVCSGPCNNTLMMTGHERIAMKLFVATTTLGMAGMMLLGKIYGAVGVAFGVSAGMIIHNLVSIGLAKRYSKIETFASLRPAYIYSLTGYLRKRGHDAAP